MREDKMKIKQFIRPARPSTALFSLLYVAAAFAGDARRPAQDLSPSEVKSLIARAIANQHKNDEALGVFERRERRQVFKASKGESPQDDKAYRVVPTGTGTLRLLIEEHGRGVTPEHYRKQLRDLEQALAWAMQPAESKQKQRVEKWKRRSRERAELVDSVAEAFEFSWQGRETLEGRALAKIGFEPDPAFKPRAKNSDVFQHVHGTIWVEETSGHVARIEAEIMKDIAVMGGIFGKIYRGGTFLMEQAPVENGVWLPVLYEYDLSGRRFVFGFDLHEVTVASGYRRIGPPVEALASVRMELNNSLVAPPAK